MTFKKVLSCAAACVALAIGSTATAQTVVNFDDLVGQTLVPPGYGGVDNWGGWTYYDWSQPPYIACSGNVRTYNNTDGAFSWNNPVTFDGACFNGYGTSNGFLPINFQLYLGGTLVHTSGSIDLDGSGTSQYLSSGYSGLVDRVVVQGFLGFFVMDDVTYDADGGMNLRLNGSCPGRVTVDVSGATAGGTVALLYASCQGSFVVGSGICAGTQLGLCSTNLQIAQTTTADGSGNASFSGSAPPVACGGYIQAVDASTCSTSNTAQLN